MISANLVFLRNYHNFSQEEVAEKIGVRNPLRFLKQVKNSHPQSKIVTYIFLAIMHICIM